MAKYRQKGIYLSEVELVRKLLYAEFYRDELTYSSTAAKNNLIKQDAKIHASAMIMPG